MACSKCGGTGMLPFKRPDGTISQYASVPCDCRPEEHDYLPPISPADFDFPMSGTFRASTYELCGLPDPGHVSSTPDKGTDENLLEQIKLLKRQIGNLRTMRPALPSKSKDIHYELD